MLGHGHRDLPAQQDPHQAHAPGAGEGGEGQGGLGAGPVQQDAAGETADDHPQGVGHVEEGLALDLVLQGHQVPDEADGGHGVQAVPRHLKHLHRKENRQGGGHPGQQRVEEKGDAGQPHPGPAPCPPQQQGKHHHGGDVHQPLHREQLAHLHAAAPHPLDDLVGEAHDDVVAGVQEGGPHQQGEQVGILPEEGGILPRGGGRRGSRPGGRDGSRAEGQGGHQQQEGGRQQHQRDGPRPPQGGEPTAQGGGQGIGPCPRPPGQPEVQRDVLGGAAHANGVEEGGQHLQQGQQDHKQPPLHPLARQQQEAQGAQPHPAHQAAGQLAQGEAAHPPGPGPCHRLQ